jgi:MFS family permease
MDSFIYSLVLVPALRELLPKSGIPATAGNVGFYGASLFALLLVGWGSAFIWGPIADKFGRVRTLMLSVLCYSLFTFLGAVSQNIWQLAVFRFFAGLGLGGEWSSVSTFIAEEWPEERRGMGAGYLHTGYYFGFFLAGMANHFVGEHHGWRAMFMIGGAPALLVSILRLGVTEPKRWITRSQELQKSSVSRPLTLIFAPEYRKRTILNSALALVSIIGLWAGSVYIPAAVSEIAGRAGMSQALAGPFTSYATMLLGIGTILGCLILPGTAEWLGRRMSMALFFFCMMLAIAIGFGPVFYLRQHALAWFLVFCFLMGVGGANFCMYTLWLPEQYPTECRGSAFSFVTSVGRFAGAGFTFLVGAGVAHFRTIGIPVALTSLAFLIGLLLLPLGIETKGQPLPH